MEAVSVATALVLLEAERALQALRLLSPASCMLTGRLSMPLRAFPDSVQTAPKHCCQPKVHSLSCRSH
ncbi:hypothetical protein WJX77_008357 [Trebouxia sp. C0004]